MKIGPRFPRPSPPRETLRDGSSENGRAPRMQWSSDEARSTQSTGPGIDAASRFSLCAPPSNSGWKERRSRACPGQSGPVPLVPVAPTSLTLSPLRNSVGQLPRSDCSRPRASRSPKSGPAGVERTGHRLAGRRSEEARPKVIAEAGVAGADPAASDREMSKSQPSMNLSASQFPATWAARRRGCW